MKKWLTAAAAAVLLLQSLLLILSVFCRPPGTDEAWIAEWAWFEAREGHARSELFRGYCHYEDRVVLLHRLFELTASWLIRLAGFRLWILRTWVVCTSAALLFLVFRFCRRRDPGGPAIAAPAVLLLFPLFFKASGFFRPEIMWALLGFGSFTLLSGAGRGWRTASVSGLLAGLAVVTHIGGLVFLLPGAVLLAWERRPRDLLPYFGGAAVALIPWLAEILSHYDLLLLQARGEIVQAKTSFSALTPLMNLLQEHERLFRNPESISASVLVITAVIATAGETLRRNRDLYRYLLAAAVTMGVISSTKTVTYTVPLLPLGSAAVFLALGDWLRGRPLGLLPRTRRWAMAVALSATAALGLWRSAGVVSGGVHLPERDNRPAGEVMPPGSSCLAPLHFVFGQIQDHRIGSLYLWRTLSDDSDVLRMDDLLAYAGDFGAGYIVLDSYWEERIGGCREFLENPPEGLAVCKAGELSVVEVVSPVR